MTYQGEPADHLLLLWKGRARYFYETPNDRKLILKWITPGHIFGAATLASEPSKYLASTEAVRDCIVLEWDGATIRGLARRFTQLLENSTLIDMDYVAWYVAAHAALSFQSARTRLASVLFGLARTIRQKASRGIEVEVTNEELSDSANITPYTASRLLSQWQKIRFNSQAARQDHPALSRAIFGLVSGEDSRGPTAEKRKIALNLRIPGVEPIFQATADKLLTSKDSPDASKEVRVGICFQT
jgi:CRP-like cAMP-binding protein